MIWELWPLRFLGTGFLEPDFNFQEGVEDTASPEPVDPFKKHAFSQALSPKKR